MTQKTKTKKHPTVYICMVTVTDPHTGGDVEVEIRKDLVSGAMVGIDGSYLEQDVGPVRSPYDRDVILIVPDDESAANLGHGPAKTPK